MKTIAQLEAENGELIKKATGLEARAVQAEASVATLTAKVASIEANAEAQAKIAADMSAKVTTETAKAEEATKAKTAAEEAAKAANMKLVDAVASATSKPVPDETENDQDILKKFNAITDNRERGEFFEKHRAKLIK